MFKKSLIAAVIGSSCGAAAGYWTPSPGTSVGPPAVTAAVPAAPVGVVSAESPPPAPPSQAGPRASSPPAVNGLDLSDAVRGARELAQRPDVTGLVALREGVLRRAEEAGEKDAPSTKRELDAIDRYLSEARALRLKLDAAEFRKGT